MISSGLMLLCATSQQSSDITAQKEIRALFEKWPKDFNAKRVALVCGLFAPDLIARYPNAPDRDYEAMCSHLRQVMHNEEKKFQYDNPHIEEILVSGEMAIVRVIWTLRIYDQATSHQSAVQEIGIDVLKRQSDGKWKISISYAYEKTGEPINGKAHPRAVRKKESPDPLKK